MATTLALDLTTLDIDLTTYPGGRLVSGLHAIAQAVAITLRTAKREWWLNASFGLSYREVWLVKSPDERVLAADLRTQLGQLQGVKRITRLELDLNRQTRNLGVVLVIETDEGELTATATDVNLSTELFVLHFSGPEGPLMLEGGLAP